MSNEPYPEVTVTGDESAIVPPQSGRGPEWPKKIRTLTAAELDRLTIDSAGRFYWDNKLVNYELANKPNEPEQKSPDAADRSAMDIIDRAVHELGDHRKPAPNVCQRDSVSRSRSGLRTGMMADSSRANWARSEDWRATSRSTACCSLLDFGSSAPSIGAGLR